jgi:hypothetical protein
MPGTNASPKRLLLLITIVVVLVTVFACSDREDG